MRRPKATSHHLLDHLQPAVVVEAGLGLTHVTGVNGKKVLGRLASLGLCHEKGQGLAKNLHQDPAPKVGRERHPNELARSLRIAATRNLEDLDPILVQNGRSLDLLRERNTDVPSLESVRRDPRQKRKNLRKGRDPALELAASEIKNPGLAPNPESARNLSVLARILEVVATRVTNQNPGLHPEKGTTAQRSAPGLETARRAAKNLNPDPSLVSVELKVPSRMMVKNESGHDLDLDPQREKSELPAKATPTCIMSPHNINASSSLHLRLLIHAPILSTRTVSMSFMFYAHVNTCESIQTCLIL